MTTKMEVQSERIPVTIEDEWQIGLAIAKQDGPIKIWFTNFQHLGLVYRFNTDGSFQLPSRLTYAHHLPGKDEGSGF